MENKATQTRTPIDLLINDPTAPEGFALNKATLFDELSEILQPDVGYPHPNSSPATPNPAPGDTREYVTFEELLIDANEKTKAEHELQACAELGRTPARAEHERSLGVNNRDGVSEGDEAAVGSEVKTPAAALLPPRAEAVEDEITQSSNFNQNYDDGSDAVMMGTKEKMEDKATQTSNPDHVFVNQFDRLKTRPQEIPELRKPFTEIRSVHVQGGCRKPSVDETEEDDGIPELEPGDNYKRSNHEQSAAKDGLKQNGDLEVDCVHPASTYHKLSVCVVDDDDNEFPDLAPVNNYEIINHGHGNDPEIAKQNDDGIQDVLESQVAEDTPTTKSVKRDDTIRPFEIHKEADPIANFILPKTNRHPPESDLVSVPSPAAIQQDDDKVNYYLARIKRREAELQERSEVRAKVKASRAVRDFGTDVPAAIKDYGQEKSKMPSIFNKINEASMKGTGHEKKPPGDCGQNHSGYRGHLGDSSHHSTPSGTYKPDPSNLYELDANGFYPYHREPYGHHSRRDAFGMSGPHIPAKILERDFKDLESITSMSAGAGLPNSKRSTRRHRLEQRPIPITRGDVLAGISTEHISNGTEAFATTMKEEEDFERDLIIARLDQRREACSSSSKRPKIRPWPAAPLLNRRNVGAMTDRQLLEATYSKVKTLHICPINCHTSGKSQAPTSEDDVFETTEEDQQALEAAIDEEIERFKTEIAVDDSPLHTITKSFQAVPPLGIARRTIVPSVPADAKASVKHIECLWYYGHYGPGGCKYSEEHCIFPHHRVKIHEPHASDVEPIEVMDHKESQNAAGDVTVSNNGADVICREEAIRSLGQVNVSFVSEGVEKSSVSGGGDRLVDGGADEDRNWIMVSSNVGEVDKIDEVEKGGWFGGLRKRAFGGA